MLNLKSHVEEMGAPSHAQSRGGTVRRRPEVGMAVSNGAAQSFGLQLWHLAGAENRPGPEYSRTVQQFVTSIRKPGTSHSIGTLSRW